jgi:hypothetical protein
MKQPYKTDIAVLMLFFNRPETFQQAFAAVKAARPSRLFLYQDGAREGNKKDKEGMEACRRIASDENIDWECDVHRHYCEHNQGCDPSGYLSQQWAFSLADKVAVIEDDVVVAPTFLPFCKEMLDRYEHDERITMVAGFNTDEVTPDVPYDYFFTSAFSIWGWASWRRVVDKWDGTYSFMRDDFNRRQLASLVKARGYRGDFMRMCTDHAAAGKPFFESVFWSSMLMNSGLAIMPTRNMVSNVGATADSTHYAALQTMPRGLRRIFTMGRHDVAFPLKHPRYVMEYAPYKEHTYRTNAWGHPVIKILRSLEELWLNIKAGNVTQIAAALARRIRKWTGNDKHA